ncbi:MAG: hypothetical protein K0R31_2505 [Clostridiales bacterium]|jgi:PAS domain S-box-containing protein|nr:hypothetical protein [Clostridiales bacterium]
MSKIVFIASGENIAEYVHQLQTQLENPQELEIVNTHMENAINYVKKQIKDDVDVIIARGNTAKVLKEAKLPFPIVTMSISDSEIIEAIKKAQERSHKEAPLIGYIGLEDVISNIRSFLEILNLQVQLYKVNSTDDIERSIAQAQKDQVDILIGGIYTCQLLEQMGINYVLLESSFSSVKDAYDRAKEVQRNVNIQKKKLQEKSTILDSVSDGIISINERGKITLMNKVAESYFNINQTDVTGRSYSTIFDNRERALIQQVLTNKEKSFGHMVDLNGRQYALAINPIIVGKRSTGAIISLHEINNIQMIENNLRKQLYETDYKVRFTFENLKGVSFEMQRTIAAGKNYAAFDSNLLIIGDPGTGRESFAQCIHYASDRKDRPFVIADCSAFSLDTIESEFNGFKRYDTTTQERKAGLFEQAHGGTLYLSEISKLNLIGQSKLLKILKVKQIQPEGSQEIIPVDVRIIASCSENLLDKVHQGLFRKELYYLLTTTLLPVPSLRQRKGDIAYLANYFIEENNEKFQKSIILSRESINVMEESPWEGNVEQLMNFCKRLAVISKEELISAEFVKHQLNDNSYFEHLGTGEMSNLLPIEEKSLSGFVINQRRITKEELKELEKFYGGNRTLMAKNLGISRSTLWKYLKLI